MIEMSSGLMNTYKRRDKQVIIAEIMKITRNGSSKTQILRKVRMSFSQINLYLALLKKINFLEKSVQKGRVVYIATPKGLEYLQKQQELVQLLRADVNLKMSVKIPPQILL